MFVAMLSGQGKDLAFYKKELLPILQTLETGFPGKMEDGQEEKGETVGEAVNRLDFSKGERRKTGEFYSLIPEGMCASKEISPKMRYLTAVTAGVTFDRPDWEDVSPILFSFQTGQKIPEIEEPLDSKEGEEQLLELTEQIHFQAAQQNRELISEKIGRFHKLASTPESYICYELGEDPVREIYRFYIFSRKFLYTGMYVGTREGLEDPEKTHLEILEKWLSTVRYEGDNPDVNLHYNRQMFREFTAEDGKLDGIKISQLFSGDVLFFNEGCFEEKEGRHEVTGLQLNGAKLAEVPSLATNFQTFGTEVLEFLREMDQVQELHVAKERIHKDFLPLLLNDFSVPLTGMTLMNLLAWHMVYIRTDLLRPREYTIVLDRNLVAAIPDAYCYIAKFVDALRRYNGRTDKFTISFLTVANFDSPLAGKLKPVTEAAQMRESCRLTVKNGVIEELPDNTGAGRPKTREEEKKLATKGKKSSEEKPAAPKAASKQSEDTRKEQIEKKRKEAVEQYLKQVASDYEKKKQELEKEINSLLEEKEQQEQELNSAGFFQFSRKSSLKQIIRGLEAQYANKLSERKELEKQKEEALKDPCFKIDRKIREELAKETEKIVNDNLCNIREKDQKLGAFIDMQRYHCYNYNINGSAFM